MRDGCSQMKGIALLRHSLLLLGSAICVACSGTPVSGDTYEVNVEVSEVTDPDIDVSPDRQWVAFSLLGHIFRLPIEGGHAEQLTFGAYYDSEPVFSPDGSQLVFVSDRDGGADLYLLDLKRGEVRPITSGAHADRPVWAPDGRSIVYLETLLQAEQGTWEWAGYAPAPAIVRRVELGGTDPEVVIPQPQRYRSLGFGSDGNLIAVRVERGATAGDWSSRVEAVDGVGEVTELAVIRGLIDRLHVSPSGQYIYACLVNGQHGRKNRFHEGLRRHDRSHRCIDVAGALRWIAESGVLIRIF